MRQGGIWTQAQERVKALPVERGHVKLLLPAVGVLAGYAGAFLGAWAVFLVTTRVWLTAPLLWMCFVAAGLAAMVPVDSALGEKASHADLIQVPVYWTGAAVVLLALHWLAGAAYSAVVPAFFDNLALWGAGVVAIWLDEPDSTLRARLRALSSRAPKR